MSEKILTFEKILFWFLNIIKEFSFYNFCLKIQSKSQKYLKLFQYKNFGVLISKKITLPQTLQQSSHPSIKNPYLGINVRTPQSVINEIWVCELYFKTGLI